MPGKSKISISQPRLSDLIYEIGNRGTIRIPRFQRDYVWKRPEVAKLLDSVWREFPIGSFFLWITPREFKNLYKQIPELGLPEPSEFDQIKMILDGQQRITSLYVAARGLSLSLNGASEKDYKKICFDLDEKNFPVVSRSEDCVRTVSVWRLFDQKGFDEVYDQLTPERRQVFRQCRDTVVNYPLSIVEVEGKNLEEAVIIFERINQGGKRLTLFDLVVANTWSNDFDLKAKTKELNQQLENVGFGKVDEEVITYALALSIKGHCTRAHQLQLKNEDIKANWRATAEGLKLTVDFMRENLGVRIAEFLPYPPMLAIMAAFFVKIGNRSPNALQAAFLKEWFWKAAFSQRYAKAVMTTLGMDWGTFFEPVTRAQEVSVDYRVAINEKDIASPKMYTRSAIKNALLCLLALKKPRHFKNGTPISLDRAVCSSYNDNQKHHIFPNAYLKRGNIFNRHVVPNFTFLPKELNLFISDKTPSEYFGLFKKENPDFAGTLESHLIPGQADSGIWKDDYERFVRQRTALLLEEVKKLVGDISPEQARLENDPNNALDDLEKVLRGYLDQMLAAAAADYWNLIPSDVRDAVRRKIDDRNKRHPYERHQQLSTRGKLDFLDVMDYCKIILANWSLFESDFASKGEIEKHFLNIKEFRNSLKHGRELDNVVRKQGEASTEWLQRILDHAGFSSNASAVSNPDELNGSDEEEASEGGSVSEESLITQSTQNGTLALLTICRTLNEIWRERCSKAFGGSFRYRVQQNEHGGKYAVGINVAGKLKPTVRGELLVWLRPAKIATILELPETQVRDDIKRRFPSRVEKTPKTVVLGLKTEADATRLVSFLKTLDYGGWDGDPPKEIPDEKLRVDAIPSNASPWKTIERFALTMNGYRVIGDEEVGKLANRVKSDFEQNQRSLGKLRLTEVRGCLFFEQRRFRHFETEPEGADRVYINALLDEIRGKVSQATSEKSPV